MKAGVIFLFASAVVTLTSAFFQAGMRDPYQKLQFTAPVTTLGVFFLTVAVWCADHDPQARIKCALIGGILFLTNGVLTHATARAVRLRESGHWKLIPSEGAAQLGRENLP